MRRAMRCAVTGANGFVGSHVVRALAARGHEPVALVGADLDDVNLAGADVERRPLDLLDPTSVRAGLAGCEALVHTAACYAFWLPDPRVFYRINVDGTRHVLAAARELGMRRVVHTSTAGTLQPPFPEEDRAAVVDETSLPDPRRFRGHYKASKALAERAAFEEAARGLAVVVVQPTEVLGPGDRRPTPTGSMLVHYLAGRMKVYVEMPHDLVDVRDVADGHVLALERGAAGERYLLAGECLSMRALGALLAELTGLPRPRLALPGALLAALAGVDEWVADHWTRRPPIAPREAALHARDARRVATTKARRALGFAPRPARETLADALRWFASERRCPPDVATRVLARLDAARPAAGPRGAPLPAAGAAPERSAARRDAREAPRPAISRPAPPPPRP
jgi:dihydroflavonol-4-reductase